MIETRKGYHGFGVFDVAVQLGSHLTFLHSHVEDSEIMAPKLKQALALGKSGH